MFLAFALFGNAAALASTPQHFPRDFPDPTLVADKSATPIRLSAEMRALNVPGVSVAVIRHGRLTWTHGYGLTDLDGHPVTAFTRFQAGSISKSITALGILRMVAAGTLSLDRPVNDYLTGWQLPDGTQGSADTVTLRGLLSHTAGINVHGFDGYDRAVPVPTLGQVLDGRLPANTPPIRIVAAPGANYSYSGGGYEIAQQLVQDVSGKDFGHWAQEQILVPAGMSQSSFFPPASDIPHALGHTADGTTVAGGYHLYPEQAAAGLWTTPRDLARALLVLSTSLASKRGAALPAKVAQIVLIPVKPGASVGFDIGGTNAAPWVAKGGDTKGFAALLVFFPETGDGAVVMTNGEQGSVIADQLIHTIAAACHWPSIEQ
jgi:CubicO group peptidase (beta-lactamase class C family)